MEDDIRNLLQRILAAGGILSMELLNEVGYVLTRQEKENIVQYSESKMGGSHYDPG